MKACANCGFLATTGPGDSLVEVPGDYRKASYAYGFMPVCFARANNLYEEIRTLDDSGPRPTSSQTVVQKDRSDCPEWTRWIQGFSLREHRLMVDEREEREREARRWRWGAIGIGLLLVLASLAGPSLAVWVENRFLGGG